MKRIIRVLLEPFAKVYRVFFDPRFDQLGTRFEASIEELRAPYVEAQSEVRATAEAVRELLTFLGRDTKMLSAVLEGIEGRVAGVEGGFARVDERLEQTTKEIQQAIQEANDRLSEVTEEVTSIRSHITAVPESVEELGHRDAALLNRAESHVGLAAEKGLWLNPPVSLRYSTGQVELGDINERIVEIPFVYEEMSSLKSGARILDVGCAESSVALSLASMGYKVTGIDLQPYPFSHPNLSVVVGPLEEWEGPEKPFDGEVCLSSIEHFGLGVYGEPETEGLDLLAMERLSAWARPGARLALTVPFGRYQVTEQQRIYDLPSLKRLLAGWEIERLQMAIRLEDGSGWRVVEGEDVPEDVSGGRHSAVALVAARRREGNEG